MRGVARRRPPRERDSPTSRRARLPTGPSDPCGSFAGVMKANQTRGSLYAVCILRGGYRNGILLIQFVEDWQRCVRENGGPIGIEKYTRLGRYSYRRAYELLALFRKTFPQLGADGTPEGLMGPLLERLAAEAEAEAGDA